MDPLHLATLNSRLRTPLFDEKEEKKRLDVLNSLSFADYPCPSFLKRYIGDGKTLVKQNGEEFSYNISIETVSILFYDRAWYRQGYDHCDVQHLNRSYYQIFFNIARVLMYYNFCVADWEHFTKTEIEAVDVIARGSQRSFYNLALAIVDGDHKKVDELKTSTLNSFEEAWLALRDLTDLNWKSSVFSSFMVDAHMSLHLFYDLHKRVSYSDNLLHQAYCVGMGKLLDDYKLHAHYYTHAKPKPFPERAELYLAHCSQYKRLEKTMSSEPPSA